MMMVFEVKEFAGYHSEWNLGSPGGWDYQRITQIIGKKVWERIGESRPWGIDLDFDHPMLFPVNGFVDMLLDAHRSREGSNPGLILVVAEEETLEDVTENRNLARRLDSLEGISGGLASPQELEIRNGRVCWKGEPVSTIFMDFNTDVLIALHRKHGLQPVLQAVREKRVINPRGTEPINVKSMYELITGGSKELFHREIVERTPWTRQFYPRRTEGPDGESIGDLVEWTRANWEHLVLKPERGYSGRGVRVGGVNANADEAVQQALDSGDYIVQEKIPLDLWAEEIPALDDGELVIQKVQTDFRCLSGPEGLFGFMGRFGGVPTNVGSGGGVQPLAVLNSEMPVGEAARRINDLVMTAGRDEVSEAVRLQEKMAIDHEFTYLLGPIRLALRPRLITRGQVKSLERYCRGMWEDCLVLEQMWLSGELDGFVRLEQEELEIARLNPWRGSHAIIASDGLFGFGSEPA